MPDSWEGWKGQKPSPLMLRVPGEPNVCEDCGKTLELKYMGKPSQHVLVEPDGSYHDQPACIRWLRSRIDDLAKASR
jgi:hypothetical protein